MNALWFLWLTLSRELFGLLPVMPRRHYSTKCNVYMQCTGNRQLNVWNHRSLCQQVPVSMTAKGAVYSIIQTQWLSLWSSIIHFIFFDKSRAESDGRKQQNAYKFKHTLHTPPILNDWRTLSYGTPNHSCLIQLFSYLVQVYNYSVIYFSKFKWSHRDRCTIWFITVSS